VDFDFNETSQKFISFNDVSGPLFQLGDNSMAIYNVGGTGIEADPATGCPHLFSNNWNNEFPGDTVNPSGPNNVCRPRGAKKFERGTAQHFFVCWDLSLPAGSRVVSFGVADVGETGIMGYYNHLGSGSVTSLSGIVENGTWGGGGTKVGTSSMWINELLLMTGSSGSCVNPSA
jgi:hypothetical protein